MSELFIGSALASIDARGQLSLPESFCVAIQSRRARDELFVAPDDGSGCLIVCDQAGVSDRAVQVHSETEPEGRDTALRRTFGFAAPSRMDGRGRIAIAPWVRPRARDRRRALLVGMGRYFEIWDLDDLLDSGPGDLVQLATRHLNVAKKEDVQ